MDHFRLVSSFHPRGDQPQAIENLVQGISEGTRHQVLLGVTGSGKTFTMANAIEQVQRSTLVISHNKTLAAQLYTEFRQLFPENAVEFFVSYYDYYQPEAYIPSTDTYSLGLVTTGVARTLFSLITRMRLLRLREPQESLLLAIGCTMGSSISTRKRCPSLWEIF